MNPQGIFSAVETRDPDIEMMRRFISKQRTVRCEHLRQRLSRFPRHMVRLEDIRAVHRENSIREGVFVYG